MILKNKKQVKESMAILFDKALKYYNRKYKPDPKWHEDIIKKLITRTIEAIEEIRSPRSGKQQGFYQMFLLYMQCNTPDYFKQSYNETFKTDRKVFSKNYWHESFKDLFEKESTAHNRMDGYEFTDYVNNCMAYAANNIFHVTVEDLDESIREFYDDYSRGKILI